MTNELGTRTTPNLTRLSTQHICCVMLPSFIYRKNAPYGVLPPGVHYASLEEIKIRFATTEHRIKLFDGIIEVVTILKRANCKALYIDGSYVTEKEHPSDFDGCWDAIGVVAAALDPVLLDFSDDRAAQKRRFGGELFPASWPATSIGDVQFFEFFQTDKHTGDPKGIVGIRLEDEK